MSRRVGVFWDYENCKPPTGISGSFIAAKIRQAIQPLGPTTVFKAYMDTSLEKQWEERSRSMPSDLQSSGISLIHCPHNGGKEVADKMLIVDILLFALEQSTNASADPSTIVLITGDRDYSYLISTLRLRGHDIVLIFPPGSTNAKLKHLATAILDWRIDVIECANPEQHVKHLAQSSNVSFLPSPASSTFSRQIRSSRGSVSSFELSRGAPYPLPASRVPPESSRSRSPSSSDVFSEFELSSDELDDGYSFVCVDDIDPSPSRSSSIVDLVPGECSATTSSVTHLFSSFFKRQQAVTPPPVTTNPMLYQESTVASIPPSLLLATATVGQISNPGGGSSGSSLRHVPGSRDAKGVLQWSEGIDPYIREPDSIEAIQAQSDCAASEICLDVFGEPRRVSVDSQNGNTMALERPVTPPSADVYKQSIVHCEAPPPVFVRSSQPAGPIRICDMPTVTQFAKISPTGSKTSKPNSSTSTPVTAPPPPATKPPSKSSSPVSTSSKVSPPTSKASSNCSIPASTSSKIPPPPASKASGKSSSPAAATSSANTDARFTILVEVLRNLQKEGAACPDWSIVGSKLIKRDPGIYKKAGCSRLKTYLELAQNNGIIDMGSVGKDDAWVRLRK